MSFRGKKGFFEETEMKNINFSRGFKKKTKNAPAILKIILRL